MGRGGGSSGGHRSGSGSFHYGGSSHTHYSPGYYGGRRTVVYRQSNPMVTMMIAFLIFLMFGIVLLNSNSKPKSTVERSKLPVAECTVIDVWYQDDFLDKGNAWIYDKTELMKGLRAFYNGTGVQPYLWITDNINGKSKPTESDFENALSVMYSELFSDEGHAIVCFMESSPDVWATYVYAGENARKVLDDEAQNIIHDYFSYYYTKDLTDEEFFSTVFSKSASVMMTVSRTTRQLIYIISGVLSIAAVLLFIAIVVKIVIESKVKKAAIDKEILSMDLKDIPDSLEDKYSE